MLKILFFYISANVRIFFNVRCYVKTHNLRKCSAFPVFLMFQSVKQNSTYYFKKWGFKLFLCVVVLRI